jgi:hypothetical protein
MWIVPEKNIAKALKENPHSKILIYCGYDHLIKDTMLGADSWRHAMAGWLKLMTGIEPLTIDQTILTETGDDTLDNPYRKMIRVLCDKDSSISAHSCDSEKDHSVIMVNSSGGLQPKSRYNADFSVYHPDTKYIHGRPTWQITEGKYSKNINAKVKIGFPCLAFVYREAEDYDKAVPTDVIEIKSRDEDVQVILETKCKNVIILKSQQGKRQVLKE